MSKELLREAYVREYLFDTFEDYEEFIVRVSLWNYKVVSVTKHGDMVKAVIYTSYSNTPLYTP
jgi:hypothetical protein